MICNMHTQVLDYSSACNDHIPKFEMSNNDFFLTIVRAFQHRAAQEILLTFSMITGK